MTAPGYLEANGRVAIPERLRPPAGGSLDVVLVPRPPVTAATLVNADPSPVASIQWVTDTGGGNLEPLWLASAPPAQDGVVEIDRYSGTFVRARTTLNLQQMKHARFVLATTPGPNGAVLADTAELRAMGGVVWFDNNGSLGHVKATDTTDMATSAVADAIELGTMFGVTKSGNDINLSVAAASRRRATLGDIVLGINDYIVTLTEISANEIDITGVRPVPEPEPEPEPGVRAIDDVYAPIADLMKMLGGGQGGQDADRCALALIAASYTVDSYIGRELPTGLVPTGSPVAARHIASTGGIRSATLALAVRFYKNPENWSGVISPDTVGVYVARYVSDLDLYIAGQRERWGIA